MLAVLVPAAVGMKTNETAQLVPDASVDGIMGQVFPTMAKSPGFAPPSVNELKPAGVAPAFVIVKLCVELVEPILRAGVNE
jgi:hypothetical protein